MLPGQGKFGVVISKIPVMQSGLKVIFNENLPDYELSFCRSHDELTLLQLRRAVLVVADISGEIAHPRAVCERYYSLMTQYRDIHWVFMVSDSLYPLAVELLIRPESSLISESEPVNRLIEVICAGSRAAEQISRTLFAGDEDSDFASYHSAAMLTLSERKVLRLLAKGWGINQIAALLKKSNKTISAQKNSAMRRLSLRSNAEMYAWINSAQGMQELNINSAYGEQMEWKKIVQPRHVAIVEKCVMTEMAWRYIFSREDNRRYHIHLFKNVSMLRAAEIPFPWSTIIFSLSGSRSSRAESLLFVHEMARCRPEVQTIILANNESEMHLIGHLMPACLHGILNKSAPRRGLQERLLQLLDNHHLSGSEQFCDREACNDPLSPTEHAILRYMSWGYSLSDIAIQLNRNIKTIRAHKFNAMTKLGVRSDIGLLNAADILLHLPLNSTTSAVKQVA